jgi:hypothetical protein
MEITSSVQYWQIKQTKTLLWDELFLRYTPGLSLINRLSQRSLITPYRWRLKARFIAINLDSTGIFSITLSCKKNFLGYRKLKKGPQVAV